MAFEFPHGRFLDQVRQLHKDFARSKTQKVFRSPKELGIYLIPGKRKELMSFLNQELKEGTLESVLLDQDILEVRQHLITKIAFDLMKYRHSKKFPNSRWVKENPTQLRTQAECYFSFGTLMGVLAPSDLRAISLILKWLGEDVDRRFDLKYDYLDTDLDKYFGDYAFQRPLKQFHSFNDVSQKVQTVKDKMRRRGKNVRYLLLPGSFRPFHVSHAGLIQYWKRKYGLVVGVHSDGLMERLVSEGLKLKKGYSAFSVLKRISSLPCLDFQFDDITLIHYASSAYGIDQAADEIKQIGVDCLYIGSPQEPYYEIRKKVAQVAGVKPVEVGLDLGIHGSDLRADFEDSVRLAQLSLYELHGMSLPEHQVRRSLSKRLRMGIDE